VIGKLGRDAGIWANMPNTHTWLQAVYWINLVLLVFNLLPIYPLDGGQIFRSLLWFVLGRARSLMVATAVGFLGVAGLIALALWKQSLWFAAISFFLLMNCWGGLQQARALSKIAKLPRRPGFACPTCHSGPPVGNYWVCRQCGQPFDTFQAQAVCPSCGTRSDVTQCLDCRRAHPMYAWAEAAVSAS
jgi:hypothetical protein